MKAEELDKIFDEGKEDILQKRVNVDLPIWMIQKLDRQANLIGVTRQSIIKVWLSDRIKKEYAEQDAGANALPRAAHLWCSQENIPLEMDAF